jgi:hypothetical protein
MLKCDKCGTIIDHTNYDSAWGNCEKCGDILCDVCSPNWSEDGECKSCSEKVEVK